jgi:hypothetical protein
MIRNPENRQSKLKLLLWMFLLFSLVGCNLVRQNLEVTRVVEKQVEVTRLVEVTQEVTRVVEVPVEVTRIVQEKVPVTVEVTVEVTRIVGDNVKKSPTPEPTDTPPPPPTEPATTPTLRPFTPTAPPSGPSDADAAKQMDGFLRSMGGMIDAALRSGELNCTEWVASWDAFMALPAVGTQTQFARAALLAFGEMTDNCRNTVLSGEGNTIPFQQWGNIRQAINDALEAIRPLVEG